MFGEKKIQLCLKRIFQIWRRVYGYFEKLLKMHKQEF